MPQVSAIVCPRTQRDARACPWFGTLQYIPDSDVCRLSHRRRRRRHCRRQTRDQVHGYSIFFSKRFPHTE